MTKFRIVPPSTPADVTLDVSNAAGADSSTATFTEAPVVIEPPVATDFAITVTVGQQFTQNVVSVAGNTGEGRVVSGVGAVSGSSDDEVAEVVSSTQVTFVAGATAETVTFTYTLSTGDGGVTSGGTDTGTITVTKRAVPQPGDGTVTIEVSDASVPNGRLSVAPQLIAPAGHFFYAEAEGFGVADHYTDVRYKWTFDDPGILTRSDTDDVPWDRVYDVDGTTYVVKGPKVYDLAGNLHPTPAVKEVQKGYRPNHGTVRTFLGCDRNVAYGPRAVHVFNEPGTYTVTCEVQARGGAPVTKTIDVTVLDPAVEMDDTYVVATDGNFTGAPAGAIQHTDLQTAIDAANASASGLKRRILLKRGQTFSSGKIYPNTYLAAWQLGAFGTGNPPHVDAGVVAKSATTEVAVWGVNLSPGSYNAADPFNTQPVYNAFETTRNGRCTLSDLGLANCDHLILFGAQKVFNLVGQDIHGTNWHRYGIFSNVGCGVYGFKGAFIRQDINAVTGSGEDESVAPFYVDHGPQRAAGLGGPVVLSLCDLRVVGSRTAPTGYFQPNIRMGRSPSGVGPLIEEAVMERIRGELGQMFGTGNSGSSARARKYLWDKCYLASANQSGAFFTPGVTGLHYRNIVLVNADTKGNVGDTWFERKYADNNTAQDRDSIGEHGVDLYNATLVDLRDDTPMGFELDLLHNGEIKNGTAQDPQYLPAHHVKIGNNVIHCPNKVDPTDTGDGPFDTTDMWVSDFPGIRFETITPIDTGYAIPAGSLAYYELAAGSPAIGDASLTDSTVGNGQGAPIAVDDFFGNLRGPVTSRGAFD